MQGERRSQGYQIFLVLVLSLNFGIVFFDRNAINFLMPDIRPALGLNDTQVGNLSSALSFTWAISGFAVGWFSDKIGSRKPIIVGATIAFCLCSFISGIATSFLMLFGARLLMGLAEGGVMPVSHSVIVAEVDEKNRGLAMGVGQNLGSNLLGTALASLVLVPVAAAWGWRNAFYLAAIPGLITAIIIWLKVDEPPKQAFAADDAPRASLLQAFKNSNMILCSIISVLLVSYLVVCWTFMPLYLTENLKISPTATSWLMATLGFSAAIGSFVVSAWSDRIGRKPVIVGFSFLGVILPLGVLFLHDNVWMLGLLFFFGWGLNSVFPIFMATVPSESVDARLTASLSGITVGLGEVIGGVFSPTFAGSLSVDYGRTSVLWFMLALCTLSGIVALGLKETAPRVLARRATQKAIST